MIQFIYNNQENQIELYFILILPALDILLMFTNMLILTQEVHYFEDFFRETYFSFSNLNNNENG